MTRPASIEQAVQQLAWAVLALAGALVIAVVAWRYLPRYEIRQAVQGDVLVYDKWAGRLQRAQWDANGHLHVQDVYAPF